MHAISQASEVRAAEPEGEVLPLLVTRARRAASSPMWPELAARMVWRGFFPLLQALRRSWIYRQTLTGALPEKILFHPSDARARRLDEADAIMRGRFKLAGETVEITHGSIFDAAAKSVDFSEALHGFEWLRHLEAAGGDAARNIALALTRNWLERNALFSLPSWAPEVIARRLFNLFAHGSFFLANSDLVWRSKLLVSLREQMVVLSRSLDECEHGLPRLEAAAALALSGLCLGDERCTGGGLKRLSFELERQILPDGGHIGRSPEALLEIFRWLGAVEQGLAASRPDKAGTYMPVLDRIGFMLHFLRMGDGRLAKFHGGNLGEESVIASLLGRKRQKDETLPAHVPDSGFQRLCAGRTLILMDTGTLPPPRYSGDAHASSLSVEISSGEDRMIVNCGAGIGAGSQWSAVLRATAAHSTLTLDDTSQATILANETFARRLGQRMTGGPNLVETRRTQGAQGISIEATHDAYAARFGLMHQRRLNLNPKGSRISGIDRLIAVAADGRGKTILERARKAGIPFAVRFHVHPDVRLSLAKAMGSVILKLPGGGGWRFRCNGGTLSIEESIYWGEGFPRRAEQLAIESTFNESQAEIAWVFEELNGA